MGILLQAKAKVNEILLEIYNEFPYNATMDKANGKAGQGDLRSPGSLKREHQTSYQLIYTWIAKGWLNSVKIDGKIFVSAAEFKRVFAERASKRMKG